jgi:hypothetical protein
LAQRKAGAAQLAAAIVEDEMQGWFVACQTVDCDIECCCY